MKVKFKVEKNYCKNKENHQRVFYIDLIPGITYRYYADEWCHEHNFYLSWLAWVVSVTLTNRRTKQRDQI